MKLHVLVVLGLAVVSFSSPARSELTTAQRMELREKLYSLADALDDGDVDKAVSATTALQRWGLDNEPALPLNWLCLRSRELAKDDFDPGSKEIVQFIAAVRRLGDGCAEAGESSYDASAAKRTLAEVLSGTEYRVQMNDSVGWWHRMIIRFLLWLNGILSRLMSKEPMARIANSVFYIALAVLLLPLISLIAYLIWKQFQSREASPPVATARSLATLDAPDVHLGRAREFFQRGEFVEALKQYHLAVLAHLEHRGIVVHDRTRTNWEYLAQVQRKMDSPVSLALLRKLNLVYDKAVFGRQPCNAVLVKDFSQTVDEFLTAINQFNSPPASP